MEEGFVQCSEIRCRGIEIGGVGGGRRDGSIVEVVVVVVVVSGGDVDVKITYQIAQARGEQGIEGTGTIIGLGHVDSGIVDGLGGNLILILVLV